jgi:hypothetical protein
MWVRLLWWALLMFDLIMMASGQASRHITADMLILFAEYAVTITTIPPRATKREQREVKA